MPPAAWSEGVPFLVLINGAPGTGKSTIASRLAESDPQGLALDLDVIKHALPDWEANPTEAGLQARAIWLDRARSLLARKINVYVGQYLARPEFVAQLDALVREVEGQFVELILCIDADQLATRLSERIERPDRPEHEVNNRLLGPADLPELLRSIETIRTLRPHAIDIDASGDIAETAAAARRHISR